MDENFKDIHKAKKLLEINKMLTKSLKIEEILKSVIIAATELIDVSGVFIIYLYDEKTKTLKFAEGQDVNKEAFEKIAFAPGESIAGRVFQEKKSKLFTSEEEIDDYMKNMTAKNYQYYYKGIKERKIKSTFVVPIVNKNRCYGMVVVNNFSRKNIFTKEDMQVIEVVADQTAIAIDNSNVYQDLKEKNNLLRQSYAIHNQFYELIIEGRGIENVISLLEKIIESPVQFDHEIKEYDKENIFPIVRGNERLGLLKFEKAFNDFSYMSKIAIEQASLPIALELVKNNALFEKEIHFREEVFNQLMEGISDRDLQHALQYVKWKKDWTVQCMIMEGKDKSLWQLDKLIEKERFIQSIERISQSLGIDSLIFTRTFQVIVIVPEPKKNRLYELIKQIKIYWNNMEVIYGIGRETNIKELSVSYQEAIRSIGYAKHHQMEIVEYAMLGVERLLYEVDEDVLKMFMHDKLQHLYSLDESFIETLQVFIHLNKNHKLTAEHLHIHANTLYYRLRKIEEALDIQFDDEKDWIDFVIAFRLYVASNKKDG
ncbi:MULTISPECIES: helix-turn-helix domain-containing protein [Oceanobacillus]|uniref:Helix-turn-helix domain-containing protein n=1 Tax=Oceanobacillus aidingensis TaxID=645964 RepID=A0ABV9JZ11_9BACI|nr:helix-turn-helix domain-containing protein [Oceanobacillus oncorhynchi]MDM8102280.1 helix-turn-helix domain-containing protein [Oceanobacillus oncorhynchi]